MNKKYDLLIVFLSTIIISFLFHRQFLGINLFLYETVLFLWLYFSKLYKFSGRNQITIGIGLLITSLFTILTHSLFSYIINFLTLFIFIGVIIYPEVKSIINSLALSFSNLLDSQLRFVKELSSTTVKGINFGRYIRKFNLFLLPILIVLVFIFLYRKSNPIFDKLLVNFSDSINKYLSFIFYDFDALIFLTLLIGLVISNFIFLRASNQKIIRGDLSSITELKRQRNKVNKYFKITALKNEYQAGVFLLLILNAILLIVNVIDINWVWFNFEWEGQYLKQFVHEGTYLLILSIIISIALVLFLFRGNINFLSNNKKLRHLSYFWLAQNAILTISVAVRNFYYINYFSLAYKRIGVIIFLGLVIYGLYTVLMKVKYRKSAFYLFRSNSLAVYVVLVFTSLIDWDSFIAKHNFKNANSSFLHLDYLSNLSDKSLPYLDKSLAELNEIDKFQKKKFPFDVKYMTPEVYHETIEKRKLKFINKWEAKSILSWNLPEYLAYKKLTSE